MRRFEEEVARTKHSKVMGRVVRRERVSSVGGGGGMEELQEQSITLSVSISITCIHAHIVYHVNTSYVLLSFLPCPILHTSTTSSRIHCIEVPKRNTRTQFMGNRSTR